MNVLQKIKLALLVKRAEKEIQMNGFKNFLTSKTLIGLLGASLPLLSQVTGIGGDVLQGVVGQVVQAVGLLFSAYGRVTATKQLTVLPQ